MNEVKYYRVHVAYIASTGEIIKKGVYAEASIDVAEASRRSYITPELNHVHEPSDATVDKVTDITVKQSGPARGSDDIKDIKLEAAVNPSNPKSVSINLITKTAIVDLKYVGEKTALKVITEREKCGFESYEDLNKRVPLSANKKWETVAYMVFEAIDGRQTSSKPAYEISNTAS